MAVSEKQLLALLAETEKLQSKYELSKTVGPDHFEPGMMEYLDQYRGVYLSDKGKLTLRFDARGTRYDGRTRVLEDVSDKQSLQIIRDKENIFNSNNFRIMTEDGKDVGNMPAELCNVIAPLYDAGSLIIEHAKISYLEPVTKRSRYARQAVLFVEMKCRIKQ